MNKQHLKSLALELRAEISVDPYGVFDPYALAELYGVPVFQIGDLDCSPAARAHFAGPAVSVFSGALVPMGDGATVILENDAHAHERRRATISHELAHLVLEHDFDARLVSDRGCRVAKGHQEQEASELGAELLLPAAAALAHARRDSSNEDVADAFRVSVALATWRMNSTGARKRAQREREKRASSGLAADLRVTP